MSWKGGQNRKENYGRNSEFGQTSGYKPWSDFGPLGRNRALPSCHSSLYQQRDEEPSSLERGGRAQQQERMREKVRKNREERTNKTDKRLFYSASLQWEEGFVANNKKILYIVNYQRNYQWVTELNPRSTKSQLLSMLRNSEKVWEEQVFVPSITSSINNFWQLSPGLNLRQVILN